MTGRPPSSTPSPSTPLFRSLLLCRARFLDEPRTGQAPPAVEIELPDGARVRSGEPCADEALSRFLGVACALGSARAPRSEEHTSELQSPDHLVCPLLLAKNT